MTLGSTPVLCNYYLTYRCNAKCSFCDIWERPSSYVNRDDYFNNLNALKKLGVKVIDFTGGEPLLHREIASFAREAKKMGFITTITTNCLLYPKYAESLRGVVDMLHFSLDSIDETTHNKGRGVSCYMHVMQSIEMAIALGERPDILYTVTNDNINELNEVYEKICCKYNLLLIVNPIFAYNDIGSTLTELQLSALYSFAEKEGVYLNTSFLQLRLDGGNKTNKPVCKAGSSTVVISPENKLIVPCYHSEDFSFDINGNLAELWLSHEVKQAREMQGKLKACDGCVINCYMQPSFIASYSKYTLPSLASAIKYSLNKWVYV